MAICSGKGGCGARKNDSEFSRTATGKPISLCKPCKATQARGRVESPPEDYLPMVAILWSRRPILVAVAVYFVQMDLFVVVLCN